MKKLLLLGLACLALNSAVVVQSATEQKEPTLHAQIAKNYLPSVSDALPEEETGSAFWQSVRQTFNIVEKTKMLKENLRISERDECEIALNLLGLHYEQAKKSDEPKRLSTQAWRDLELFSNDHATSTTVLSQIDRTRTILGRMKLAETLTLPTTDTDLLLKRQEAIWTLASNQQLYTRLQKELCNLKDVEKSFLACWKNQQKITGDKTHKGMLVSLLDQFGHSTLFNEALIRWSQFYGIFSSAVSCTVGRKLMGNNPTILGRPILPPDADIGSKLSIKAIGLLYTLLSAIPLYALKDDADMRVLLQEFLIDISRGVSSMNRLAATISKSAQLRDNQLGIEKHLKAFLQHAPAKSSELSQLLSLLDTNTFKGSASYASWAGKIQVADRLLKEIKDLFIDAFVGIAELDVLISAATLMQETSAEAITFSSAKYLTGKTPTVRLQSFWHPMIDRAEVVPNSLVLGEHGASNNSIITGPNAGGKSTVLKAATLNVLMAQTLGICPSIETSITPFASINTYLNISDDIAAGNSLFKSEVLRAQELVQNVEGLKEDAFSFTILDEMFCGTSPLEGAAASYSVAKYLSSFPNSILMCATHFPMLTNLEEDTDYLFKNYKVGVLRNEDGTITYPYKLLTGKANQHVAIDILRLEGFSSKILDDAYAIVNAQGPFGVAGA